MIGTTNSGVDRLLELDRRYLRGNLAIATVVALISPFYATRYGWTVVLWACVPLMSGLVGLAFLRERLGLDRWYVLHLALTSAAMVGPTLAAGGMESPLFPFIPIAGLLWVTYFPEHQASLAAAPLMTAAVVLYSWQDSSLNPDIRVFEVATPFIIISIVVPLLAVRLVESELLYRQRAVIDQLTGCLNRHAFASRSAELEAQMSITNESVGVVVCDVDHFKKINDAHGHAMGDRVLVDMTYAVRKELRSFESFYRTGGEEFAVLVAGGTIDDTKDLAEQIREATSRASETLNVTVSCGVAVASRELDIDIDEAVKLADAAMYEAKRTGRDRVVVADRCRGARGGTTVEM